MRRFLMFAAVSFHGWAAAQAPEPNCLLVPDDKARLACWDNRAGYVAPPAAAVAAAPSGAANPAASADGTAATKADAGNTGKHAGGILLRDDVSFDTAAVLKDGKKAATLQFTRSDGKDVTTAKMAALYGFDAFSHDSPVVRMLPVLRGWNGFAGVGWIRDPNAKTPKDQREAALGVIGANFDGPVSTLSSAKLARRHENVSDTEISVANFNVNLVVLRWVTQPQEAGQTWHLPVPYFGLFAEDRKSVKNAAADGLFHGMYLGWRHTAKLLAINDRLSANLQLQHYRDFNATAGQGERRKNFGSAGISYALPSPEAAWFVPSIELKHERGTDPVTGGGPVRKTTLGLGLKVN